MLPLPPPWAQNDIQKRAQILHKSIPGCTDGGGILPRFPFEHLLATSPHLEKCDIMSRFFLRNTYWQHCPMFKHVVACCVFPFNICCQHFPMFRNVILCRVFSVFKWTVAFLFCLNISWRHSPMFPPSDAHLSINISIRGHWWGGGTLVQQRPEVSLGKVIFVIIYDYDYILHVIVIFVCCVSFMLQESIRGALVGGQHSRIWKNEILCCVSSFQTPTDNITLCSNMW